VPHARYRALRTLPNRRVGPWRADSRSWGRQTRETAGRRARTLCRTPATHARLLPCDFRIAGDLAVCRAASQTASGRSGYCLHAEFRIRIHNEFLRDLDRLRLPVPALSRSGRRDSHFPPPIVASNSPEKGGLVFRSARDEMRRTVYQFVIF